MTHQVSHAQAAAGALAIDRIDVSPHVDASLAYIVTGDGKPAVDTTNPNDRVEHNARWAAYQVEIENGRLNGDTFSLDREGFALAHHDTAVSDFGDEDEIKRVYYPEMERLLKRETGAGRVLVFDHNVRRDGGAPEEQGEARQAVRRIHNDYTLNSAPRRFEDLLGADIASLEGKRAAIVNVWRPIRGPVESAPLALADASSVPAQDVIAADLIYEDRVGEIYYAAYNPDHRWVYFPRLERNEALLIKGYDSADDGRARFSLHTAFDDPTSPEDAAPRESIEVRALVVFD